jgi:uncharacterized protein (TIGR02271 family)
MAKTLIGLYDTFAKAEQVVQDLVAENFTRHDISLATHDAAGRHMDKSYSDKATMIGDSRALMERLTSLGVPEAEASTYAEGVRRGGSLVVVKTSDARAERGLDIMQRANLVDIDARAAQWRQEGWDRYQPEAAPYTEAEVRQERERYGQQRADEGTRRIPVVEEELSVGKREVERGRVRIHSHMEERPVEESVQVREERVTVERHPVNRPATEADLTASQNETIEVTETAEEPVVRKRARVVEEVTVHKDVEEHTETVRDTVRRTDVDVEQVGAQSGTAARGFEAYTPAFRQHHTSTFADRGGVYKDYEPAYRYGYELSMNPQYRGRDWRGLESDARRDWEARRAGTWDQYRDAIYYGWDKSRVRPQG